MLHPPKSIFEKRSNHDRVIALAYKVLVHDVGGWKLENLFQFGSLAHQDARLLTGFLLGNAKGLRFRSAVAVARGVNGLPVQFEIQRAPSSPTAGLLTS